ncbi:BDR-repeat family protein (plasmid) [Borrelia nietonii YOR]|uniref:BDR-repeat family protein n=2 Tax=Borrelia TaxID=138 RepID=W5SGG2_9SPIR|nr:Bdr family repetitive protein [Borrelia nietonii]AHH04221.1 BDR-repeat family protein [Borrelia nietonii YOR]AHH14471.1 BDR-repeat family protein [Borrelia hermsii MTW]UPA10051.1 hypothetical protein bhYOR_001410 [Borrelia nietonii YOR]
MQDSSLHSVANTQIFNGHITEEIIYQEFVKMGMQDFIANDLSKRYYRNELTYKDIEYLENNFNLKLEMLERSLKSEIISVKAELDNKIDIVRNELKTDIASVSNEISLVRKDMEINKMELNSKLDKTTSEFKSTSRLHNWMFGTLITLNIGIFLALMSLLVK